MFQDYEVKAGIARVAVSCGCGFTGDSLEAGQQHAAATGHSLSVAGVVAGAKRQRPRILVRRRPRLDDGGDEAA